MGKRAIVIGAGIAGLCTAQILSDFFETVTVVERDELPSSDVFRAGVPQGRHMHLLLAKGRESLYDIFPRLGARLESANVPLLDFPRHFRIYRSGTWLPSPGIPTGIFSHMVGRPKLENLIRQELVVTSNVEIRQRISARELILTPGGEEVEGIAVSESSGSGGSRVLSSDLVVATGGGVPVLRWLRRIGFPQPEETIHRSGSAYSSRRYRSIRFEPPWKAMTILPHPPRVQRGGIIYPYDEESWHVGLLGHEGGLPPTGGAAFLEFAKSLASDEIYRAIVSAEPVTEPLRHIVKMSRLRHFEKLRRHPRGFLVTGDALCLLNPIYGQGITVAALDALAIRDSLRQIQGEGSHPLDVLPRLFYKRAARHLKSAWNRTKIGDARLAGRQNVRLAPWIRWGMWYADRLSEAADHDEELAVQIRRVGHMLMPGSTLMTPKVVWYTLAHYLRSRLHAKSVNVTGRRLAGQSKPRKS